MAEEKNMRLSLAAKKLNIGLHTIVEKLATKGHKVEDNPNARLNFNQLQILANEYKAPQLLEDSAPKPVVEAFVLPKKNKNQAEDAGILYFRDSPKTEAPKPEPQPISTPKATEPELIKAKAEVNLKIVGKIDLATGKPIEEPKPEPAKVETPRVDAPKVETPRVEIPKVETLQVETPKVEPAKEVTASLASLRVDAPPIVETPKVEMPKATPVVEAPKVQQQPVANKPVQQVGDRPQQQPNRPQQANQQPQRTDNRNNDRNRNDQNRNQQGGGTQNRNQQGGPGGGQNRNQNPQGGGQNQPKKPREEYKIPPQRSLNDRINTQPVTTPPPVIEAEVNVELIEAKGATLKGLTVLGKIQLPTEQSRNDRERDRRKKRKRIPKTGERVTEKEMSKEPGVPRPPKDGQARPAGTGQGTQGGGNNQHRRPSGTGGTGTTTGTGTNTGTGNNTGANNRRRGGTPTTGANREEVSQKDVQDQIKATMARMSGNTNKPAFGAKERRQKRKHRAERAEQQFQQEQEEAKVLKVTEFISASDLASLMDVSVNEVISTCMSMGMFVSINQRLDAEAITIIADEFNFEVTFVSAEEEIEAALAQEIDRPEDLVPRAPIVTVMGHVDHGKTSLLDYIRRTKVAAGEAGGITQHIGAYRVTTDSGHDITFLDTPGHEAFTAMRARGAKVTDVAIIVIAADDSVMPQTREAINHAQVAGVPIVFAFTKIDKPGANTDKIRTELSAMNLNVVEWGGKYESQEISSKSGAGIADLLEKVVLETEILDFKANPNKKAVGTIIEASLDKGRGYVATVLIQSGTLKQGDMMLAGSYYGRVKAMLDYNGNKLKTAGPSTPVQILGLNGAPSAGDKLNSMENERDAREIAGKREQILREQSMRTRKHITLDEIGRRKAIGVFKELNVIVKGDVDGSVEALSDALLKLSTEEVQVRIIHKAVGQVSESDVLLASASDAIIVAFQVRPSVNAKRLADQEQIEIRNYSIIYQAIDEIRDAMEGLLEPKMEEHVTSNIEVRDVFKITKVGTVAGCYVLDGTVKRAHKIRVIRDFIVVHEGDISALKRFKEDVAEVKFGYECGLSIKNFNDIEVGDMLECYEMKEVKRTL